VSFKTVTPAKLLCAGGTPSRGKDVGGSGPVRFTAIGVTPRRDLETGDEPWDIAGSHISGDIGTQGP
jgi:hypothetical protein